jgi:alkaline phosphatase D
MTLDLHDLRAALRHEGGVSRRLFLAYGAALATLPLLSEQAHGALRSAAFQDNPFSLGVASGDPDHTGFVIWTRLAPQPLEPNGGMPPAPVAVDWQVTEDEAGKTVVRSGTATAAALLGHSVHVEVDGLRPDRWYWYRFKVGDTLSPVGRSRSLPEPGARPDKLRFAFASCQHWEAGLFTAYEQMAKDDLDLVLHLGDYIYEGGGRDGALRKHAGPKLMTLTDYRVRYAQYRTDPLLQAVHQRFPWFVTTDDHEVENNYAGDIAGRAGVVDPAEFLLQRANAYQAYYEVMPLRRRSLPRGPDMQLYQKAKFGRLAEILVLDTRQYRSDQTNGDKPSDINASALDPKRTLLGATQREWLKDSLSKSSGTWNILAQQVMMGMVDRTPGGEKLYSMDQWPGYAAERMALVRYLADRKVSNPVVLTGDIHTNWVNSLRVDDRRADTPVIATEFVGTSISSGGDGSPIPKNLDTLLAENPCVRYYNQQRGYVRCTVTPASWRSDYLVVDQVTKPGGVISTAASFQVQNGRPGAEKL